MKAIHTFEGSAQSCGAHYQEVYQREIAGFFCQEFKGYKYSPQFVKRCLSAMKRHTPQAEKFLRGMAKKSLLTVEQHVLMLLHEEELYHRNLKRTAGHCTAVAASAHRVHSKNVVMGQNWDWDTSYFPWRSLNRFKITGLPAVTTLSFPGLPICAGINSRGLSLMYTGSGYYPPLIPVPGVPTYALVFELLLQKDVTSAEKLLRRVKHSGAFIFLIGEPTGKLLVAEAAPGHMTLKYEERSFRANVYEYPEAIRYSKQKLPPFKKCHSLRRIRILSKSASRLRGYPKVSEVMRILSKRDIKVEQKHAHATLVQLVSDCRAKALYVREWRGKGELWRKYKAS